MHKTNAYLTLAATLYMSLGSIIMVALFGFEVSSELDRPVVEFFLEPAGYAFIIWGLIYLGYIALGLYQIRPAMWEDPRFVEARPYLILNAFFNSFWFIGVARNFLWMTVLCMLVMLLTLIQLSRYLELGQSGQNRAEKWWVKLPIALYFGWITLATPINITSWLAAEVGWTGASLFSPAVWSTLILGIAAAIILTLYLTRQVNGAYLLVGVWGLFAIFIANLARSSLVAATALGLAGLLALVLINRYFEDKAAFSLL
ncbi:MAG: hypothetical protein AAFR61_21430 [Bacteroidota bacterium]